MPAMAERIEYFNGTVANALSLAVRQPHVGNPASRIGSGI
jgi:hypothetical protein